MTSSLVGSEMCIRDSLREVPPQRALRLDIKDVAKMLREAPDAAAQPSACLLYTSDAADDM
eukprot:9156209-Prorocentrum_lima.AAC.1